MPGGAVTYDALPERLKADIQASYLDGALTQYNLFDFYDAFTGGNVQLGRSDWADGRYRRVLLQPVNRVRPNYDAYTLLRFDLTFGPTGGTTRSLFLSRYIFHLIPEKREHSLIDPYTDFSFTVPLSTVGIKGPPKPVSYTHLTLPTKRIV